MFGEYFLIVAAVVFIAATYVMEVENKKEPNQIIVIDHFEFD